MTEPTNSADETPAAPSELTRLPARALLLLVVLTLIWGNNYPYTKVAVEEIPVFVVRAICGVGGGLLVLALAALAGRSLRLNAVERRWILPASLCNATLWLYFSGLSLSYITAGHTAVAAYTMPLYVFLLSIPFLGERPTAGKWLGLGLGMAAVAVLLFRNFDMVGGDWRGIAAMMVAASSWAVGTILMKKVPWEAPVLVLVGWQFLLGGIPLMIFAVPAFLDMEPASLLAWSGTAYSTILGVSVAYWLWFKIVQMVPASVASISVLAVPAVSLISGALLLGEPLGWMEIAALLLIVGGVSTVLPKLGSDKPLASATSK